MLILLSACSKYQLYKLIHVSEVFSSCCVALRLLKKSINATLITNFIHFYLLTTEFSKNDSKGFQ